MVRDAIAVAIGKNHLAIGISLDLTINKNLLTGGNTILVVIRIPIIRNENVSAFLSRIGIVVVQVSIPIQIFLGGRDAVAIIIGLELIIEHVYRENQTAVGWDAGTRLNVVPQARGIKMAPTP